MPGPSRIVAPGFFYCRVHETEKEAKQMGRGRSDLRRPYGPGDYYLVSGRQAGTYWQKADGLVVQLAAGESTRSRRAPAVRESFPLLASWRIAFARFA